MDLPEHDKLSEIRLLTLYPSVPTISGLNNDPVRADLAIFSLQARNTHDGDLRQRLAKVTAEPWPWGVRADALTVERFRKGSASPGRESLTNFSRKRTPSPSWKGEFMWGDFVVLAFEGGEKKRKEIFVNGKEVEVDRGLERGLRVLRDMLPVVLGVRIWVDVLCAEEGCEDNLWRRRRIEENAFEVLSWRAGKYGPGLSATRTFPSEVPRLGAEIVPSKHAPPRHRRSDSDRAPARRRVEGGSMLLGRESGRSGEEHKLGRGVETDSKSATASDSRGTTAVDSEDGSDHDLRGREWQRSYRWARNRRAIRRGEALSSNPVIMTVRDNDKVSLP